MIKGLLKAAFVLGINITVAGGITVFVIIGSAQLGHALNYFESLTVLMLATIQGLLIYQIVNNKS